MNDLWAELWGDVCLNGGVRDIVLAFPLTNSLIGQVDGVESVGNFARVAGVSTVEDFEGVIHNCLDGEARFWKARRVENLLSSGSDHSSLVNDVGVGFAGNGLDNLAGKDCTSVEVAVGVPNSANHCIISNNIDIRIGEAFEHQFQYTLSRLLTGAETVRVIVTGSNGLPHTDITVNNQPAVGVWEHISLPPENVIAVAGLITFRVYIQGAGVQNDPVTIYIADRQVSKVHIAESSEYVSVGVEADPWHGANVDGVEYFGTDRSGNPLTGMRGCLGEAEATNSLQYSEDFENVRWAKSETTVENLPDGVGLITWVDGAIGNIQQNGIVATEGSVWTWSMELRLISGNPEFLILRLQSSDGGAGNNDLMLSGLTSEFVRYSVTGTIAELATRANFLLRNNTLGVEDLVVEIRYPQGELSSHASTYIPTEAVAVTRPAEALSVASPAVLLGSAVNDFGMRMEWFPVSNGATNVGGDAYLFIAQGVASDNRLRSVIGAVGQVYTQKSIDGASEDVSIADIGHLSQKHVMGIEVRSDSGLTVTVDETSGNNPATTDLNFTGGSDILQIGGANGGLSGQINSGISAVYISPITI